MPYAKYLLQDLASAKAFVRNGSANVDVFPPLLLSLQSFPMTILFHLMINRFI